MAETLTSIIEGVIAAQEMYPAGSGTAAINHVDRPGDIANIPHTATEVSFDVAVTSETETEKGSEKKAGLNIRVVEAGVSGAKGEKERNEAISRVAFKVPVNLPVTHTSALAERKRSRTVIPSSAPGSWMGPR